MKLFRLFFVVTVFLIQVQRLVLANDDHIEMLSLVKNCDLEMETQQLDGSCFLLGIKASKSENIQLFSKIESLCIDVFAISIFDNYSAYEDFLAYFPKCNYVVLSKIKSKKDLKFDSQIEVKELVRFLNSH